MQWIPDPRSIRAWVKHFAHKKTICWQSWRSFSSFRAPSVEAPSSPQRSPEKSAQQPQSMRCPRINYWLLFAFWEGDNEPLLHSKMPGTTLGNCMLILSYWLRCSFSQGSRNRSCEWRTVCSQSLCHRSICPCGGWAILAYSSFLMNVDLTLTLRIWQSICEVRFKMLSVFDICANPAKILHS